MRLCVRLQESLLPQPRRSALASRLAALSWLLGLLGSIVKYLTCFHKSVTSVIDREECCAVRLLACMALGIPLSMMHTSTQTMTQKTATSDVASDAACDEARCGE